MPGTAAWHEDHVSLDVARAFSFYADATGDEEFLRTKAWPVLSGVAEWLTSRVTRTAAATISPSPWASPSENSPCATRPSLTWARSWFCGTPSRRGAAWLPIRSAWIKLADGIAIPRRGKAIVSHDDYRSNEEKGATPDPLMGIFPLDLRLIRKRASDLGALSGNAEDYIGSPMLSALYGAWAARGRSSLGAEVAR